MNIRASDVKGLNIFSDSEEKNVGKSKGVVFDLGAKKVTAILVKDSGILGEGRAVLISDVKSIDKERVVVESESTIKGEADLPPETAQLLKAESGIPKSKVMTEDGEVLGKVSDLIFNPGDGQMEELEAEAGGVKIKIKAEDVMAMNSEMVTVKSEVKTELEMTEESKLKGKLADFTESIKGKIQEKKEEFFSGEKVDNPKDGESKQPVESQNIKQGLSQETIQVRGESGAVRLKRDNQKQGQSKLQGTFRPGEQPQGEIKISNRTGL